MKIKPYKIQNIEMSTPVCPNCGSSFYKNIGNSILLCKMCGNIFMVECSDTFYEVEE